MSRGGRVVIDTPALAQITMHIALLGTSADQAQLIVRSLHAHQCSFLRHPGALAEHPDIHLLIITLTDAAHTTAALAWAQHHQKPVLLLANPSDQARLFAAVTAGASDYILLPLRKPELLTRVTVLLKQRYADYDDRQQYRFGDFVFAMPGYHVSYRDEDIILTQKEFALALLLLNHIGHPVSRAYIQESIWGTQEAIPTRTIDTHISRVRNKLGLQPARGYHLTPVYGFGYQLSRTST